MASDMVLKRTTTLLSLLIVGALIAGCGSEEPEIDFGDGGASAAQIAAARSTAQTNSSCTSLGNFYWEIGNVNSILVSGQVGSGAISRTTVHEVASASKWMFGAYVFQIKNGAPTSLDKKFLRMLAGYTSLTNTSCSDSSNGGDSVGACQSFGTNGGYDSGSDGVFAYDGGHYQKWAVENGMSQLTKSSLATQYRTVLGTELPITFARPQLAGGVSTSAAGYAQFLRKLISKQLSLGNNLGKEPVCTVPGAAGCTAAESPITAGLHYSYGHWIEDDSTGDGAFSSPGAFGFYPWIDATKKFYGVISRKDNSADDGIGSGEASMVCGRKIRAAFKSGVAQ
ncbi:MAG: hypothetical protein EOP05_15500 [Proteobacteria bacterium]|nr:MAG: hypothetical protein EOP05_15500 [Pseudomonadota bacterium]